MNQVNKTESGPAIGFSVESWLGVCSVCGTKLALSDGWVPSYNDPDNAGLAPNAEPFCPKCEAESLRRPAQTTIKI